MSLLIISRNKDKLAKTKADVLESAKAKGVEVQIDFLAYDFTDVAGADAFYASLVKEAQRMDKDGGIGMLINNVRAGCHPDTPNPKRTPSSQTVPLTVA